MVDKINVGGTEHDINDTGARGMIFPDEFSTGKSYAEGDCCIYNNALYKFTAAKSAGAWDDSVAAMTTITAELQSLKEKDDELSEKIDTKLKSVIVTRTAEYSFKHSATSNTVKYITLSPPTVSGYTLIGAFVKSSLRADGSLYSIQNDATVMATLNGSANLEDTVVIQFIYCPS